VIVLRRGAEKVLQARRRGFEEGLPGLGVAEGRGGLHRLHSQVVYVRCEVSASSANRFSQVRRLGGMEVK
jgi:hypothetical protein